MVFNFLSFKDRNYLNPVVAEDFRSCACQHLEPIIWNADGQGLDPDASAMVLNDHLLPVDPAAQNPLAAIQEIDAVVLDVEPDQVTA